MGYVIAGPLVAIVGIVAIFFVLRRKSVDKRSMYSSRRSQIEHKVRAARQRTLAPHGHVEKPTEPAPGATTAQAMPQPTVTWERPAFEPPPVAPPAPPAPSQGPVAPPPWETGPSAPAPAPSSFDFPATTEPYQVPPSEPFRPAPEPTPRTSPSEPAWTPAPRPAEPLAPAEQVQPAAAASAASSTASATSAGSWSVVSTSKDSAVTAETRAGKKKKGGDPGSTSSWQLASGDAPDMDAEDETGVRTANRTIVAVAQYAVLVVGLVMVLIGVLVMVANSHVT